MKKYVIKRVLIAIATTLVILLILYSMLDLMPGSPFNDEKMSAEQKAALNEKYGLDDPFLVRYLRYVGNMLHGDFGVSYAIQKNMPISRMLAARIPITLQIGNRCSHKTKQHLGYHGYDHIRLGREPPIFCICASAFLHLFL